MKPLEAVKTKKRRTANRKPSLMIKPTNRTWQTEEEEEEEGEDEEEEDEEEEDEAEPN